MQKLDEAEVREAILELFGNVPHLDLYAKAVVLFTDENAALEAFKAVDGELAARSKTYAVTADGTVAERNAGLQTRVGELQNANTELDQQMTALNKKIQQRTTAVKNVVANNRVLRKADIPTMQAKAVRDDRTLQQYAAQSPGITLSKSANSRQIAALESKKRLFSFAKPLAELEHEWLGLIDRRRTFIGFVPDVTFLEMVDAGEVWKDSLSDKHGEYTHRLQWLAFASALKQPKDTLNAMYKGSIVKSKAKMRDGKLRDTTLLWDFLVDCFPATGLFNAKTSLKTHVVTDSFRSPRITTESLEATTKTPFITSYLRSSKAKLELSGIQFLTEYRQGQLEKGYGEKIANDDTVFSPGKTGYEIIAANSSTRATPDYVFADARF